MKIITLTRVVDPGILLHIARRGDPQNRRMKGPWKNKKTPRINVTAWLYSQCMRHHNNFHCVPKLSRSRRRSAGGHQAATWAYKAGLYPG